MVMMERVATVASVSVSGAGFDELFAAQRDKLFSAMWLVARDRHEAEDLAQEAFVRVWERWDRSGAPDDPVGYLYRTAMNLFLNRRRRAAMAARRALRSDPSADALEAVEARDEVRRALQALTPSQRAALVLLDLLDMSSDDAARVLGVRPSTVRVLAARGRAALTRELGANDD